MEQIPFVIQFIENIFAIYDGNRSGNLGVRESLRAYPVFKRLLKDLSSLGSDEELQAVFTYLLKNSAPPSQGVEGAIRFYWWKINRRSWALDVDRAKLTETLAVITEATSKKK